MHDANEVLIDARLRGLSRSAVTGCAALVLSACPGASEEGEDEVGSTGETDTTETETDTGETDTTDTETDTETDTGETETGDPNACWEDLAVGELEVLAEGFDGGSEGITFGPNGELYVTTDGTVWSVSPDGEVVEYATVPDALGLAARADGSLVVASLGVFGEPDGAVYVVSPDAAVSELAAGIDSPNFVAIAPDGSALITDDVDTRVFRVSDEGEVSVIIEDVPSPNGMAYSPDGQRFYVASTFTPEGQLTAYTVDGEGFPDESTGVEILHIGQGSTPDGIAVDENDRVYVAANLFGEIWAVDGGLTELGEGELVAGELESPASLAFGRGPDFDPCSIYYTELFGTRVMRLAVGVRGAPLFD